jgi:hypothetical protein
LSLPVMDAVHQDGAPAAGSLSASVIASRYHGRQRDGLVLPHLAAVPLCRGNTLP